MVCLVSFFVYGLIFKKQSNYICIVHMYRAVMCSFLLERAHMAMIVTSSNISYRTIHGHLSTSPKLEMPSFSGIFLSLLLFMFLPHSEFVLDLFIAFCNGWSCHRPLVYTSYEKKVKVMERL